MAQSSLSDSFNPGPIGERGLGLGCVNPELGARDVRLIRKAVTDGWQIPAAAMAELPAAMLEIVSAKRDDGRTKHSTRARLSAARVVVSMHGQNCKLDDGGNAPPFLSMETRMEQLAAIGMAVSTGLPMLVEALPTGDGESVR